MTPATTPSVENCERHEREINRLRDTAANQAKALAEKSTELVALQHDHTALAERLPEDLPEFMGEVRVTLKNLARGQDSVVEALQKAYITTAEFDPVKRAAESAASKDDIKAILDAHAQFVKKAEDTYATKESVKPIVGAFWKAASIIATALLLAWLATIVKSAAH